MQRQLKKPYFSTETTNPTMIINTAAQQTVETVN